MSDNLKRKQPEDPKKINTSQEWEVEYWCDVLRCSETQLKKAIGKAGPMVDDVREWLRKHQTT